MNTANDPFNCGGCDKRCEGNTPFCGDGMCTQAPCAATILCSAGATCCGNTCCGAGQLCCEDQGPVSARADVLHADGRPAHLSAGLRAAVHQRSQQEEEHHARRHRRGARQGQQAADLDLEYTDEPADVRHLGPMAQDFRASFGLGDDDRTYNAIDAHGVALAAIQALEKRVVEQGKRIERLERENRRLRSAPR